MPTSHEAPADPAEPCAHPVPLAQTHARHLREDPPDAAHPQFSRLTHKELQDYIRFFNNKDAKHVTNELFNFISHLVGAIAFVLLTILMSVACVQHGRSALFTAACVAYGLSITFMLAASTLHHSVGLGGYTWGVYRTFKMMDHVAIFVAIWGSFLPFCASIVPWPWDLVIFATVTAIGATGIALKAVFMGKVRMVWFVALYIVMGWCGLAFIAFIPSQLGWGSLALMFAMGVCYTIGAVFYSKHWPILRPGVFQAHELWHIFVLLASLFHAANVFLYLIPAAGAF